MSHGIVELRRIDASETGRICFDAYCLDGDGWHMGRVAVDASGGDASFVPSPAAIEVGIVPIPSIMRYVDMAGPNGIPHVLGWPGKGVEVRNMIRKVAYVLRQQDDMERGRP